MDDIHRTYNYEDGVKGFGMSMGNVGTKSNVHGEGKEERINLVDTLKSLQRDVQSYKDNNERLMKAKDQQDGFNIKMLQSLDGIERKMDKETKSSKSRSHRSHANKEESISVGRHHRHSPTLSRRAYNNPSISPIRKHKKSYGKDEL